MTQKRPEGISEVKENIHGIIRFYDPSRKFGLIDTDDSSYIFFITGFRERTSHNKVSESIGRIVTFSLKPDLKNKDRMIAYDIIFK